MHSDGPDNVPTLADQVPAGRHCSSDASDSEKSQRRSTGTGGTAVAKKKVVRINSVDNSTALDLRDLEADGSAPHGSSQHRSATFDQFALLYAMGLTLFGFVFPLSNYVSVKPFSPWLLAAFYIILHLVSIAFLLFFLGWILRRPAHTLFLTVAGNQLSETGRPVVFRVGGANSKDSHPQQPPQNSPTVQEAQIELLDPGAVDNLDCGDSVSVASVGSRQSDATTAATAASMSRRRRDRGMGDRLNSTLLQNARDLGVQEIPACSVLSLQESHSPSFFLRVACFIFGALKVTHEFLIIVDTLTDVAGGCASSQAEAAGLVIQYVLSICFTVLQTFFIFKYSKVSVNVYRKHSVLGFMHLVATNMCVWFQAVLLETSHSTAKTKDKNASNYSYYSGNSNASTTTMSSTTAAASSCSKDVFWSMAPYLFPFTIEYALMAAFSSYSLYRNVSKFLDVIQTKGFNVAKLCLRNRMRTQTSFSASCYKTDKGFFLGAVLLVMGLVSGIYFTVYVNDTPSNPATCQLIYQVTDLALLAANLVLCIVAYCKLRLLTLSHRVGTGPDSWLLGITLIGVLAFQLFQLFGLPVEEGVFLGLRLTQGLVSIAQSVFQVFLVLDGEKRRSKTPEAIEEKPGREAIAAVLLGNIALWVVYTLEIREINNLPNYSQAYVPVASSIFTYVCSPLIIFFRFHSACCFVEIWRTAYKGKRRRSRSHPDMTACSTLSGSTHELADVGQ